MTKIYWLRAIYAKTAIRWIDWLLEGEGIDPENGSSDIASGWRATKTYLALRVIRDEIPY